MREDVSTNVPEEGAGKRRLALLPAMATSMEA
jgi:hypothetical protein